MALFTIATLGCVWLPANSQPTNANVATSSDIETIQITSKVFHNTRTLRVLLPPGYHEARNRNRRYPVLYFNDGITVFKSRTFRVQERVVPLIQSGAIPPIIVVGIDNGGAADQSKNPEADRTNEFLPFPDTGFPPHHIYPADPPNPKGQLYPEFLVREVMPLIQQHYRVKTGPSNTGLGGFSYGAVSALYTAINKPGTFGMLLLESAPLWIGPDRQLLEVAKRTRKWPRSVYIGSGTEETQEEDVRLEGHQDELALIGIIRLNSAATRVKSVTEEGGTHDPSSWGRRLPDALRFLFTAERTRK